MEGFTNMRCCPLSDTRTMVAPAMNANESPTDRTKGRQFHSRTSPTTEADDTATANVRDAKRMVNDLPKVAICMGDQLYVNHRSDNEEHESGGKRKLLEAGCYECVGLGAHREYNGQDGHRGDCHHTVSGEGVKHPISE